MEGSVYSDFWRYIGTKVCEVRQIPDICNEDVDGDGNYQKVDGSGVRICTIRSIMHRGKCSYSIDDSKLGVGEVRMYE